MDMIDSPTTVNGILAFIVAVLITLVIWGIRQFISGKVVHRSVVDDLVQNWKDSYTEKKSEAEAWKKNYEAEHATHLLTIQQNIKLLEVAHTADKVLNALPSVDKPHSVGEG